MNIQQILQMLSRGSRPGMPGGISQPPSSFGAAGQGGGTLQQLAQLQQQKAAQTGQPIGAIGAAQNPLMQGMTSLTQGIKMGGDLQQLLQQLQSGKAGADGAVSMDSVGMMMPADASGGAGGMDPLKMAAMSQLQNK